ncbi:hypothetical protein PG994_005457 [Apiospora phragmitis]|uniref:Uncharacterized protein n=1 Tax=Apiospora phragmitis TaxID=2905665 RepID=A0ABR1VEU6_9PEZI
MRFQTPLLVLASLLSVASAWPFPDPRNHARKFGVSTGADHDYGQNKRDNGPVARAGGFEPGLVLVGMGGGPFIPATMPPQGHTGPGAGKNTEDNEPCLPPATPSKVLHA